MPAATRLRKAEWHDPLVKAEPQPLILSSRKSRVIRTSEKPLALAMGSVTESPRLP